MLKFEVSIDIEKPVEEVFKFVAKGENNNKWNSAVTQVKKISQGEVKKGSQFSMIRQLQNARVENVYEIIEYEMNKKLSIKIISGPTPFVYYYRFDSQDKRTELSLIAEVEKEGLIEVLGTKARIMPNFLLIKFLKSGVKHNFKTLKTILEMTH